MKVTNRTYKSRILGIVNKLGSAITGTIRKEYEIYYGDTLSWATIKRHLELLYKENKIDKKLISKGKERSIFIYSKIPTL